MTTTWKAVNDQAPKYIQQLLQRKSQENDNRKSSNKLLLFEPVSWNKNKFKDKAFFFVASKLRNYLTALKIQSL